MAGKLNGQRCYLAGPIDHSEDDGIAWRIEMTEWLSERGVMALDPTNKRTSNTIFNEIGDEQKNLGQLRELGRFNELRDAMKPIVLADLRMVEVSDFLIVYLDPSVQMCGTWEELFVGLRQHKPVFVVVNGGKQKLNFWMFGRINPDFVFDSFEDVKNYLDQVDNETIRADSSRWIFFDYNTDPEILSTSQT
jgi:nucleoside 2-deoxyribosyltransferase